jgi:putative transposase
MVRRARTVVPGYVHHAMQYGMGGQDVFFSREDYETYLHLLHRFSTRHGLSIWAYSLLPDHIRLIAVPLNEDSLALTLRDTHSFYAMYLNATNKLPGQTWQGRFASCVVDDLFVFPVVRLAESEPMRMGLVKHAHKYAWSSAPAHCGLEEDILLTDKFPPPGAIEDWAAWLGNVADDISLEKKLLLRTRTGHPFGSSSFTAELEGITGRILHPLKRGPKPRKPQTGTS